MRRLLPLLFTLTVAVQWLFSAGRPFYFPLDDAYITLHNARALWAGTDLNYGVPPLVGATSLVHLAVVSALLPMLGPVRADVAVCLAGTLAYLWGVERLAFRHGLSALATAALLLVAAGTASMVFQLCNGLETSLVLAGVTWAILLADSDEPSRALCLLCGALPFLHPELGVLSAVLLLRQARRRLQHGQAAQIAADLALAFLAAAPWILWSWSATGAVLPNTASAKVAFFADARRPLGWKIETAAWAVVTGIGLPAAALPFARRSSLALALWAFAVVFLVASLLMYASGLLAYGGRYTVALLPACLWALCAWAGSPRVCMALLAACALTACIDLVHALSELKRLSLVSADEAAAVAWADRNLPHDQTVLVHDAGISAYASSLRLCDVVGLKTPDAMALHQTLTARAGDAGRAAAIARIASDHGARFAIIHHAPFWSQVGDALAEHGWRLQQVRARAVPEGYDVFRLTPPS